MADRYAVFLTFKESLLFLLAFCPKEFDNVHQGFIRIIGPYSFPTMLRVAESSDHYIAELLGSTSILEPAQYRLKEPLSTEKIKSTTAFFTPGFPADDEKNSVINISSHHNTFQHLIFCTQVDMESFRNKMGFDLFNPRLQRKRATVPLQILSSANYLLFQDMVLLRMDSFRVLLRSISTAIVVKKNITKSNLLEFQNWIMQGSGLSLDQGWGFVPGLSLGYAPDAETFARELTSLADQNIKESIIDDFIQTHGDRFAKALGYKRVLSQIRLEWIERKSEDPQYSIPDYLLEREDGYFDILDLKKALLKNPVAIGKKSRVKFNSYVSELCAQLQGYTRYFINPVNRKWAYERYGIRVNEPKLYGIVGNYDSFDDVRVSLVLEQYKDNIAILSYQSLIDLLRTLSKNKVDRD